MVEIAQLQEDNRRLMEMLKNTKEFKEFSGFVEDSGGDVRHLEGPQRDRGSAMKEMPANAQKSSQQ